MKGLGSSPQRRDIYISVPRALNFNLAPAIPTRLPRHRFHASLPNGFVNVLRDFCRYPWPGQLWPGRCGRVSSLIFVLRCPAPPPAPTPHYRSGTRQNQRNTCELKKSQKRASVSQRHYGNHPNEIPALDWSIQTKVKCLNYSRIAFAKNLWTSVKNAIRTFKQTNQVFPC